MENETMELGTGWDHNGDGWSVSVGGACPVQGEGRVDGLPFYFRARGEGWSFRIAASPDGDPVDVGWCNGPNGWATEGDYGAFPDAGWMSVEHSRAIIDACIRRWREVRDAGEWPLRTFTVDGVPTAPEPRS